MDIFRLIGAFAIASCGIGGAYLLNSNAKIALWQAQGFIDFLRFLRSEVECFSMPLPAILSRCPPEILSSCSYRAERSPQTLEDFFERSNIKEEQLRACLDRFAGSFGRGYRDEQLALCDTYIGEIERIRKKLADQLPARIKVNGVLCVCSSMAVVVLLI